MGTVMRNGVRRRVMVSSMRTIPNAMIEKVKQVLEMMGPVPVINFPETYHGITKEIIDPEELGMDGGLKFFFEQIEEIEIVSYKYGLAIKLRDDYKRQVNGMKQLLTFSEITTDDKENNPLQSIVGWESNQSEFNEIPQSFWDHFNVSIRKISVHKSPYESSLMRAPERVKSDLEHLDLLFKIHPDGIKLGQLSKLIHIDKWCYNLPSLEEIVTSCPEIFYYEEIRNHSPSERLLFLGKTKTHSDLNGRRIQVSFETRLTILRYSLLDGIYQKTILLICNQGSQGLKLGVWSSSMKESFDFGPHEHIILNASPLAWFLLLASEGLIQIRSMRNCLNDLRAFLPKSSIVLDIVKRIIDQPLVAPEFNYALGDHLDFYSHSLENVARKITKFNQEVTTMKSNGLRPIKIWFDESYSNCEASDGVIAHDLV